MYPTLFLLRTLSLALLNTVRNISASNVLTAMAAGPTPGNRNFVRLFELTLPKIEWGPADYQTWNVNLCNTLDVAPHAWSIDEEAFPDQNIHNLFTMYGPREDLELSAKINLGIGLAALAPIAYCPIRSVKFTGKLQPMGLSVSLLEFLEAVFVQHIDEYFRHLGIRGPTAPVKGGKIAARVPLIAGIP